MSQTWANLVAPKGQPGSIANFISYGKVQSETEFILAEAQTLIYTLLRAREMRTHTRFTMPAGSSVTAVPARFLDPIGDIGSLDYNQQMIHKDESYVKKARQYQQTSGTLGVNPFTTVQNSTSVTVNLPAHGFNQESVFYTTGATAFNNVTITGTFDISSIVDTNNFTIDISPLGVLPNATSAGGGSAAIYTANNLVQGTPLYWSIWDEEIHFDYAFSIQVTCELLFFQSLPLLSASNQSNFLTARYPHLIRQACNVRAAAFMRDTETYTRDLQLLQSMVQGVQNENDMHYRGMDLMTETP